MSSNLLLNKSIEKKKKMLKSCKENFEVKKKLSVEEIFFVIH